MKIKMPSGNLKDIYIESMTVEELLKSLQIDPGEVLVSRDGHFIPEDTLLLNDDHIRIIQVVFGG